MSQQITDELRVIVEAEVERAIANFRKLDDAVDSTEKEASSLSDAIDRIAGKSMLLSAAIGGTGIAAIKFAGDNESLKASLEGLLKSAEAADAMFSSWNQRSKATPLEMDDLAAAGKQLLAFTVSADDVTDTMMRIGDVAAGVSKNIGEMGGNLTSIAEIYGKAKVQGRLFTEDINQFRGRGIPVVQELAKQFKTTEANILSLVQEGKIGFPELEKAFISMTSNGGIFEGQMQRLSEKTMGKLSTSMDNAKIAAASFGEIMLPMVNDMLDASNDMFTAFADLDEGTKRFIITMGGVVVLSGPTLLAIKGINTALTALAANPMLLGVTATVAGVALLTAEIQRQQHAYEDLNAKLKRVNDEAESVISAFAAGDKEKKLDAATTDKLIKLYPELAKEIKAYETNAKDASKAVKALNEQKTIDAAKIQIELLKKENEEIGKKVAAYIKFEDGKKKADRDNLAANNMQALKASNEALEVFKQAWDDAANKARNTTAQINESLAVIGKKLGENYSIVNIPVTITLTGDGDGKGGSGDAIKRKWQDVFAEIAKIPQEQFTQNLDKNETAGMKAGRLYVEGMEKALTVDQSIAERLGESFNLADVLTAQQDEVRKVLTDLLSSSNVDDPFEFKDESIKRIVDLFGKLETRINGLNYTKTLTGLQQKIGDLGKSEEDLAAATYRANGFTEEQTRTLMSVNAEFSRAEILKNYTVRLDEMGKSTDELARKKLVLLGATDEELKRFDEMVAKIKEAEGLRSFQEYFTEGASQMLESWGVVDKAINSTLATMTYQLANISFDAALDGINTMGQALGEGADAGESMKEAMAAMAQQILDNLPMMFLQAGLQLIANGQWALGLGFIAAAGSASFVSGYVKGKQNSADDTTENAHGNVYDGQGLRAFANGAAFTNSVVDSPTFFRYSGGTGVMGELGKTKPEAVVPLARMSNGDLGIQSAGGGGAAVNINIVNNTGAEVSRTESTAADGSRNVEIIIGQMVVGTIESGKADRAIMGRFDGLKKRGV